MNLNTLKENQKNKHGSQYGETLDKNRKYINEQKWVII